jgi:hypothetical protein
MPPLRRGVCAHLEAEADELIRQSLEGVTKHSEKSDILTPWKTAERYRREVYTSSGIADNTRRGVFGRSLNQARPDMNSRDGTFRSPGRTASLSSHVNDYNGSNGDDGDD